MRNERSRDAYEWALKRLMDSYRASGLVGNKRPRSAKEALGLAKKLATEQVSKGGQ